MIQIAPTVVSNISKYKADTKFVKYDIKNIN